MSALGRAAARAVQRALRAARPAPARPFETPPRRRDPSPARWRYRLDRLGRRASVRFLMRRVVPPALLAGAALWVWSAPAIWSRAEALAETVRGALIDRPEFAVTRLAIEGGSVELRGRVERRLEFTGPISSLRLDLRALREAVEMTPGVASARVAVLNEGVLQVLLTQRAPAALWRWEGQLHMVDAEGIVIAPVANRADRPNLPLVVGEGADRATAEALALWRLAAPLRHRLRALVRIGERRWDVALVSGQTVMLPSEGAEAALARLLDIDAAEELIARDVTLIDLRDPERPTLRLAPEAAEALRALRAPTKGKDA